MSAGLFDPWAGFRMRQPVGASDLRRAWSDTLTKTVNDGIWQEVVRHKKVAALIVPRWVHRGFADGVRPVVLDSTEARATSSDILTAAKEHGVHCVITSKGFEVISIVPPAWAEEVFREEVRT